MFAAKHLIENRSASSASALGHVSPSVPQFVSPEMAGIDPLPRLRPLATVWEGPTVPVFRMKPIVDVAAEIGRTMKPRASADEHTAGEPLRTIVARRRTVIRGYIVIAIRAYRSNANIHTHLCLCDGDRQSQARA
jgi:hypothetical protein